jgi:hypothetical protein
MPADISTSQLLTIALGVAGALIVLSGLFFWFKGRAVRLPAVGPGEPVHVFRASRLSQGNRLFPTQVLITRSSVVHYTPQWVGRLEHSIHLAHIASIKIDTNLMFSDVLIETTGGTSTVKRHGHSKADAVRMKELVEQYQTEYYRK